MATKKSTKKSGAAVGLGAAAAVAAVAAGAAGYYFYGSKNAKQHRGAAKKWATSLKRDVVREAKKLKDLDEKVIAAVVDKASRAYKGLEGITAAELRAAATELKTNWKQVQRELRASGSKAKGAVKKAAKKSTSTAKKAAKKTVKKVAKKVAK